MEYCSGGSLARLVGSYLKKQLIDLFQDKSSFSSYILTDKKEGIMLRALHCYYPQRNPSRIVVSS